MNINLKKEIFNSLKQKYESEIQNNKTTILIYFNNSVGIGEHPQHLEEIDKLLENIANAEDKLQSLNKYFSEALSD
jgi:hypothetical protein